MYKPKLKYTAFIIAIIVLMTAVFPVSILGAVTNDQLKTIIKVTPGVGRINVNGVAIPCEKPYKAGNTLYIPLRSVMEAFGADVVWQGANTTGVYFKDVSAELTTGKKEYLLNQIDMSLSAPVVYKGKTVMVPTDFVTTTFNITQTTNTSTGEISLLLENDGSLTDLSFLTGSLNKPRAGNSYFGWSLAIPKGSMITSQTFNSKDVQIENEFRGLLIYMYIQPADGKSLEKYYDSILDDPYSVIKSDLIDSSISKDTNPPYIELKYTDSYDEAVYHRIYLKNGYFYNLYLSSYDEADPEVLLKNKAVKDLLASFSLEYKGGKTDTADLSKVTYGLAKYSNYIVSADTGKKFASWEMSILPEWDKIQSASGSPYAAQFGAGTREYVNIEVSSSEGKTTEEAGKLLKSGYERNFNPALFSLKNAGMSEIAGIPAYSMTYEAKFGKTKYTYEESILVSEGLAYDITVKTTSEAYDKKKEAFANMLKTFKPYGKDAAALSSEIDKYSFNNSKNRLGKDNRTVTSENKPFLWSISLPGNWQKSSLQGQSLEYFYDSVSKATISVEAIEKKDSSANLPDTEKFDSMMLVSDMELEPVKVENIQAKGRTVKVYRYRVENDDIEDYGDITYYVFDGNGYQYCYMSSIPDITASEGNLRILSNAWDSFNILEKSGDQ